MNEPLKFSVWHAVFMLAGYTLAGFAMGWAARGHTPPPTPPNAAVIPAAPGGHWRPCPTYAAPMWVGDDPIVVEERPI